MSRRALVSFLALSVWLFGSACTTTKQLKTNALDFLYPSGTEALPATDVELKLPVRVGVAFAPAAAGKFETFTADQKEARQWDRRDGNIRPQGELIMTIEGGRQPNWPVWAAWLRECGLTEPRARGWIAQMGGRLGSGELDRRLHRIRDEGPTG